MEILCFSGLQITFSHVVDKLVIKALIGLSARLSWGKGCDLNKTFELMVILSNVTHRLQKIKTCFSLGWSTQNDEIIASKKYFAEKSKEKKLRLATHEII